MAWGFGEENKLQREKNKEKLIDSYSTLVATFEEQKRSIEKDKQTYESGASSILYELGLADTNDPNYRGNIQDFKEKVQGTRYGENPMVQLMWKITDQAKELNKVQVTYKIRLEDYQKAMDLILRSSFEMIKNLEEEKNKLKSYLGAPQDKPARKYTPKELRGEVFKRLDMNQTQAQIAAELGIAQTYVSKIKREHYDKPRDEGSVNTEEPSVSTNTPNEDKKNIVENQPYSPTTQNENSENSVKDNEKKEDS